MKYLTICCLPGWLLLSIMLSSMLVGCDGGSSAQPDTSSAIAMTAYVKQIAPAPYIAKQLRAGQSGTLGCDSVQVMAMDESGDMYVGTTSGTVLENPYTSFDEGSAIWNGISGLPTNAGITAITLDESGDIYVGIINQFGVAASVWMYSVESSAWMQLGGNFNSQINTILWEPGAIYIGTNDANVWGSYIINGTFMHWKQLTLSNGATFYSEAVKQLISAPNGLIYALTNPRGLYFNGVWSYTGNPGGGIWREVASTNVVGNTTILAITVDSSGNLYLGAKFESVVWQCNNPGHGEQCVSFATADGFGTTALAVDQSNNVYAAGYGGNVWLCPQPGDGESCSQFGNLAALTGGNTNPVQQMVASNTEQGFVLSALTRDNSVWHKAYGKQWQPLHNFAQIGMPDGSGVNTLAISESTVYVGTASGYAWRISSGIESFVLVPGGWTEGRLSGNQLTTLATDESGTVYASSGFMSSVWQLNNSGTIWNLVGYNALIPGYEPSVALTADAAGNLYAGNPEGYVCTYSAVTGRWNNLCTFLESSAITAVGAVIGTSGGDGVFVGTQSGDIWYLSDGIWKLGVSCSAGSPVLVLSGDSDGVHMWSGSYDGSICSYISGNGAVESSFNGGGTVTGIFGCGGSVCTYAAGGTWYNQFAGQSRYFMESNVFAVIPWYFPTFVAAMESSYTFGLAGVAAAVQYIPSASSLSSVETSMLGDMQFGTVYAMAVDNNPLANESNDVYIGTINGSVWHYSNSLQTWNILSNDWFSTPVSVLGIGYNESNPVSTVYAGTGDGNVALFESGGWIELSGIGTGFTLHGKERAPLTTDSSNNVYVGTLNGNVWVLLESYPNSWIHLAGDGPGGALDGSAVKVLAHYKGKNDEHIVAGTESGNLYTCTTGGCSIVTQVFDGSAILALATAPNLGAVFVGTAAGNIYQFPTNTLPIHTFTSPVNTISVDTSNALYVGTDHLWISYWNPVIESYESFIQLGESSNLQGKINAVVLDNDENAYIGTESGQIWSTRVCNN